MNLSYFYVAIIVLGLMWLIAFFFPDGKRCWAERPLESVIVAVMSTLYGGLAMGVSFNRPSLLWVVFILVTVVGRLLIRWPKKSQ